MASFDSAKWFRLLASGTLEEIQAMVKRTKHKKLFNIKDETSFKHTAVFYAVNREDESVGN
jgi:hypothetical protein